MKKLFVLLAALAAYSQPAVSPSGDVVVKQGKTQQFTATDVTWSLAAGSAGSIDSVTGVYTAPASVPVKQKFGGCQLLANDHIYNKRIDALPVHASSSTWIGTLSTVYNIRFGAEWPRNIHDASTPTVAMKFLYTPTRDGDYQVLSYNDPQAEYQTGNYVQLTEPLEADRHYFGIRKDTCIMTELYGNYVPGQNIACPLCTSQSGGSYHSLANQLTGNTDAAGLAALPTTIRLDEILSGSINHVSRVTFSPGWLDNTHIWPATKHANNGGVIPFGAILRLKASTNISSFSPTAQILLTQLKHYGSIIGDGGTNLEITTTMDVLSDPVAAAALAEVTASSLRITDFEIVDPSSLMISASSGQTAYGAYSESGQYAQVIATSNSNPSLVTKTYVTLQGATVGTKHNVAWIQSGHSRTFTAWVNGVDNPAISWSLSSAVGSIDSSTGVYTAPSGVTTPQTVNVIAASVEDPTATTIIKTTIIPAGTIRVDTGRATPYTDPSGNVWLADTAYQTGRRVTASETYAATPGQTYPNIVYRTTAYSGADFIYRVSVPNGNYKLNLLHSMGTVIPADTIRNFHIETQGEVKIPDWDMKAALQSTAGKPLVVQVPAVVTDGEFYFALRRRFPQPYPAPTGKQWPPIISGWALELDPDSTPRLTTVPLTVPTVTVGATVDFDAIGWFLASTATWSKVSGPGSINSSTGVYTAPSTPPSGADEAVVVRATSTVNPAITVDVPFSFTFGTMAVTAPATSVVASLTLQFTSAINAVPYNNVTWSATQGTINSSGLYTAPSLLPANITVTVTATSNDNPAQSASLQIVVAALPPPIRINCGPGGGFTDALGQAWSADTGYSSPSNATGVGALSIANSTPDMNLLYRNWRYRYSNQDFYYQFPLPNGRYTVTLKFADFAFDSTTDTAVPGYFHMDVAINGVTVLDGNTVPGGAGPGLGWDLDAAAGAGKTAIDKTFTTTVSNQVLRIDFMGKAGGATINGIEIIPDPIVTPRRLEGKGRFTGNGRIQ